MGLVAGYKAVSKLPGCNPVNVRSFYYAKSNSYKYHIPKKMTAKLLHPTGEMAIMAISWHWQEA